MFLDVIDSMLLTIAAIPTITVRVDASGIPKAEITRSAW